MSQDHSIETLSGRMFDFDAPTPDMVDIDDIARALGNTARFGGHTKYFYSVAEHAVLVYALLQASGFPPDVCFAGLHHDSHEAYLGDVPTPLKRILRAGDSVWDVMAHATDMAIAIALGIPLAGFEHDAVKAADQQALAYEAAILKPSGRAQHSGHGGWAQLDKADVPRRAVRGWSPDYARLMFLNAHQEAWRACLSHA